MLLHSTPAWGSLREGLVLCFSIFVEVFFGIRLVFEHAYVPYAHDIQCFVAHVFQLHSSVEIWLNGPENGWKCSVQSFSALDFQKQAENSLRIWPSTAGGAASCKGGWAIHMHHIEEHMKNLGDDA